MADWFKVYETDLDDDLLQWAMTEQPCSGIVYFALLTKCCKEKSPAIPWSTDCALLALANKVHAGVGLVNDAIALLQRIGLVSVSGGELIVTNWTSRQSEYCQKKGKPVVPTVSRHSPDTLPTVTGQSPLRGEERRGDQIKKDQKVFSVAEIVVKNKELERVIEKIKSVRSRAEAHTGLSVNDRAELASLRDREKALKADLGVVVGA